MVPPNINFWSISRKECLESQQKHAVRNRFFANTIGFKWHFQSRVQSENKMLRRKATSILDGVCVNYEQLFHPIQCTACRKCQGSSWAKFVLPEVTVFLSFSDQLHYLWVINCFGNDTRQYWTCLFQSGSLHILFSYHYILSILGEIFLLWNQSFQCLAIAAFQVQSM